jgi:hypothetical protein
MVNLGKIYVGNLGTDFQYACQTTDVLGTTNSPTDLSTASSITIILTDPYGFETSYAAAALNSPGTDGIAHFITSIITSIWTKPNFWTARAKVLFLDGSEANSNDVSFQVLP